VAQRVIDGGRPLYAPGGPHLLSRGGPATRAALCRPERMGAEGHPHRGGLGHVLQRPHHRGVRGRDLARQALPGVVMEPAMVHELHDRKEASAISPLAGKPAPASMIVDLARLEREYYERTPDVEDATQLVSFGTSGHRGSPVRGSFTEAHIAAITQAICDYRRGQRIDGPLYMGKDT